LIPWVLTYAIYVTWLFASTYTSKAGKCSIYPRHILKQNSPRVTFNKATVTLLPSTNSYATQTGSDCKREIVWQWVSKSRKCSCYNVILYIGQCSITVLSHTMLDSLWGNAWMQFRFISKSTMQTWILPMHVVNFISAMIYNISSLRFTQYVCLFYFFRHFKYSVIYIKLYVQLSVHRVH
jgi:hypothetical protein